MWWRREYHQQQPPNINQVLSLPLETPGIQLLNSPHSLPILYCATGGRNRDVRTATFENKLHVQGHRHKSTVVRNRKSSQNVQQPRHTSYLSLPRRPGTCASAIDTGSFGYFRFWRRLITSGISSSSVMSLWSREESDFVAGLIPSFCFFDCVRGRRPAGGRR